MHRKDNDSPRQKVGKSRLRTALRIVGILVLLIVLTLAAYGALWCVSFAHKGPADKVVCGSRLSGLAKSIRVYRNDYGWPTSNEWCDMLLKAGLAGEKQFICPASAAEIGQCTYGLNRNLIGMKASEVASDVVLLFESKPRWNVVGGREILTTENHNGEGCNVAFVDTHVEFVQTEDLGSLKWTVEETADDPNGQ